LDINDVLSDLMNLRHQHNSFNYFFQNMRNFDDSID
jgi:hypothetical protein